MNEQRIEAIAEIARQSIEDALELRRAYQDYCCVSQGRTYTMARLELANACMRRLTEPGDLPQLTTAIAADRVSRLPVEPAE